MKKSPKECIEVIRNTIGLFRGKNPIFDSIYEYSSCKRYTILNLNIDAFINESAEKNVEMHEIFVTCQDKNTKYYITIYNNAVIKNGPWWDYIADEIIPLLESKAEKDLNEEIFIWKTNVTLKAFA
jgi:hypothetical protein